MGVAEHQRDFAGSHHVGGNRNGRVEGEAWRRCRSIQVREKGEVVPGFVRAGRPRSREVVNHTVNREHGLHPAKESGKEPCADLKYHSPLRGSRRDQGGARSRAGGGQTRRPVSDYRQHGQRCLRADSGAPS